MATIAENLQIIQSSLADIKTAIIDKGVTIDGDITTYAEKIDSIETGGGGGGTPTYTGHADVEGLRAIGWTDEDIEYYQANGVNWNEEEDEYHKVTDDNKALFGLTADDMYSWEENRDRIVYLPKIDMSGYEYTADMFSGCYSLVAIPQLDTSSVVDMGGMFRNCYSLVSIPQLDTSSVTNMDEMFYNCHSLVSIPQLDTSSVTSTWCMFSGCYSLVSIPQLDTSSVTYMGLMFYSCYSLVSIPQLDTSSVEDIEGLEHMFYSCYSLVSIPQLNVSSIEDTEGMFYDCHSLTTANLQNVTSSHDLSSATKLLKESLLYIINNEAATSAITITLASYAYTRWSADADVVAALANHPNISIASA